MKLTEGLKGLMAQYFAIIGIVFKKYHRKNVVLKEVRETEEVNSGVYWYLQWHVFAGCFVTKFV